ncbi:MAG: CerR family C-terminal domain-containing protein [Emcibacter sp.]|nr:CerR family C-terminal domain-containing protein [Emcibacter sp.]
MSKKENYKVSGVDVRDAKDKIIHAAEELFARDGFNGTSVRQIALKAGVPVTLVSYHFNSKLGVYRAIFEARTPAIVEQRKAGLLLASLEDDPRRMLDLIIKAVLVPMLKLRAEEGNCLFGMLLAREINDPQSVERGIIKDIFDPVAKLVMEHLRVALPEYDDAKITWAYQSIVGIMSCVMGDAGRIKSLSNGAADADDANAAIRHLSALLLNGIVGLSKLDRGNNKA